MTEIATIDWFGRGGGASVFSENTAIFRFILLDILQRIMQLNGILY